MNYLAHGYRHLADPWFVAGTALPDWLRVLDRRARVPPATLSPHAASDDRRIASLARGALRHHEDDRRFHGGAAFRETRSAVADLIRGVLPTDEGHRPSFLAHLVIEVQLDASLLEEDPGRLNAYYAALESLDPQEIESAVRSLAPTGPDGVARLVRAFVRERFLADYSDPLTLVRRLDRVVRRVRQPGLPASLADVLAATRACVERRRGELLA